MKKVNYYRFSAYGLTLKQDNVFFEGVSFEQMKAIYHFDKKLRELLMNYMESIEIEFRTKIAYYHAHEFGPLGYENPTNFEKSWPYTKFKESLQRKIDQSGNELFIQHHKSKYNGEYPFWVAIEVTSFTDVSKLFRNLLRTTKNKVVKDYNIPHVYIASWLHTLSYIRNICAHYGRLYGKSLVIKPKLFKDVDKGINSNFVFSAVDVICKLLDLNDKTNFLITLQALLEEYADGIDLKDISFPDNWQKLLE